jgi:lipopolysaccharide/colanic/teichoic acid biosynthesis glycosyltransferase
MRSPVNRSNEELVPREVLDLLIRRECARADRNGREFSLVLFRVKNQKRTSVSTHRLARTVLSRARLTDEVGWFSDHYICGLLPDTSAQGAQIFMNSICDLVERKAARPLAVVYSYPGNLLSAGDAAFNSSAANSRPDRFDDNNDSSGGGGGRLHVGGRDRVTAGAPIRRNVAATLRAAESAAVHSGLNRIDNNGHVASSAAVGELKRSDLMPALSRGLSSEHDAAGLPAETIHDFLVHPMPAWKRFLDVVGAVLLLMLFSPVMALVALLVKLTSPGGPVLFSQDRAGLGGKPFKIHKFRTMVVDAEARLQHLRGLSEQDGPAFKLKNDPRVTRLGRVLRKTSLDELPQLWNVIKGEMSLVGPRPLPLEESEKCLQWQRRRLDVTPGLTCIWQVKGRSTVSFAEWIRMDVEYIRRRTILHDLSLLAMTIPAVLLRRGAR